MSFSWDGILHYVFNFDTSTAPILPVFYYISNMQPKLCANCEETIVGAGKFCSACGQKSAVHRLTLKDVLHDGFHYFTHADRGFIQLLGALLKKPGVVAREYIAGKRKRYFPPLNFFLLVAGIYLFMSTFLHRFEQLNTTADTNITAQTTQMSAKKLKMIAIVKERKEKALWFVTHYSNFIAMFAAPFITIFVWLMYRKAGYNYTEHLTANLYLIGFTNLYNCLVLMPLSYLVNLPGSESSIFAVIFAVCEIIYRTFFYYRFINQPQKQTVLKTAVKSTIAVMCWMLFTLTCIAIYITLGFVGKVD